MQYIELLKEKGSAVFYFTVRGSRQAMNRKRRYVDVGTYHRSQTACWPTLPSYSANLLHRLSTTKWCNLPTHKQYKDWPEKN